MKNVKGIRSWGRSHVIASIGKMFWKNNASTMERRNFFSGSMIHFVEGRQLWVLLLPETWIVEESGV